MAILKLDTRKCTPEMIADLEQTIKDLDEFSAGVDDYIDRIKQIRDNDRYEALVREATKVR